MIKNYPIFIAPDNVWDDIINRTGKQKKKIGILSRAALIKKVGYSISIIGLVLGIFGILYTEHITNTSTTKYFGYINEIDTLTNTMDINLENTLTQINQL